jgi:hypothetical protein
MRSSFSFFGGGGPYTARARAHPPPPPRLGLFAKIRSSLVPDELPASNWRADCPIRAATAPLGCLAMGPLTQLSSLSAI